MDEILKNHIDLGFEVSQHIETPSLEPDFKEYLKIGYYPFYFQNKDDASYLLKLKETINTVLEVDIPTITNIRYSTIKKFKKFKLLNPSIYYKKYDIIFSIH